MATKILAELFFSGGFSSPLLKGTNTGDYLLDDLILVVSSGGDDSDVSRPVTSAGGDLTAYPFATRQAAVDAVPKNLGIYTAEIQDSRVTAEAVTVSGFVGKKLKIVGTASTMTSLTMEGNDALIELESFTPGTLTCNRNKRIDLTDMVVSANATITDTDHVVATGLTLSAQLHLNGGGFAELEGAVNVGNILVDGYRKVLTYLTADDCTTTALRALHCGYVGHELAANNCEATPLELVNCNYTEPVGDGLTGTNPEASFAVMLSAGGHHVLTGTTMTGADDLDFDGYTIDWASLSAENYLSGATAAFWTDNFWVLLGSFRVVNNSSNDYDDFRVRDLQFSRFFKQYGADRALPTSDILIDGYIDGAYVEITATAGGVQADAFWVGSQQTIVTVCATDHDSVKFWSDIERPGTGFGTHGEIRNASANIVDLYPNSGTKIFLNGADLGTDNPCELPPGYQVFWLTDSDGNWHLTMPPVFTSNVIFEGQVSQTIPATLTTGGTTITVDWDDGNLQVIDLQGASGNVTLTFNNAAEGAALALKIIQGSTPRDIVWPGEVLWPGGTAPVITAVDNAIDLVTMVVDEVANVLATFQQAYG